jgi:hypothetical protein
VVGAFGGRGEEGCAGRDAEGLVAVHLLDVLGVLVVGLRGREGIVGKTGDRNRQVFLAPRRGLSLRV